MNLRMRQICLVARELAPTVETFREVFGLDVCFREMEMPFWLEKAKADAEELA